MNRYSPYYDPDEQRTIMSIDEDGSWVHISQVKRLELSAASAHKLATDFEKILIREGGVEGAYERRLAEALRERDASRNQALRLQEIIVTKESNYDIDVRNLVKQRDEARAEVTSLQEEYEVMREDSERLRRERDEARAEVKDLESRLAALQETSRATMRVIAEGQREACAVVVERNVAEPQLRACLAACVRQGTPLVTDAQMELDRF